MASAADGGARNDPGTAGPAEATTWADHGLEASTTTDGTAPAAESTRLSSPPEAAELVRSVARLRICASCCGDAGAVRLPGTGGSFGAAGRSAKTSLNAVGTTTVALRIAMRLPGRPWLRLGHIDEVKWRSAAIGLSFRDPAPLPVACAVYSASQAALKCGARFAVNVGYARFGQLRRCGWRVGLALSVR